VRSRISARADRSSCLMSAACSGVWPGSIPITVRLRTSRRTLSSLVCNSERVGVTVTRRPDRLGAFDRFTLSQRTLFQWSLVCRGLRFLPKPPRSFQGIDLYALPPRDFIAGLVQLPMMSAA
jgi:hypothetical protein